MQYALISFGEASLPLPTITYLWLAPEGLIVEILFVISTEVALRRAMTYDNHPSIHPSQSHLYIALETTSHEDKLTQIRDKF